MRRPETRTRRLRAISVRSRVLAGVGLLFLGYALPYRGGTVPMSLLLGPWGSRLPSSRLFFTPLKPVGVVVLVLSVTLASKWRLRRPLAAGIIAGVGVEETLYFLGLIGNGLVHSVAIWFGLAGALTVLSAGVGAARQAGDEAPC